MYDDKDMEYNYNLLKFNIIYIERCFMLFSCLKCKVIVDIKYDFWYF